MEEIMMILNANYKKSITAVEGATVTAKSLILDGKSMQKATWWQWLTGRSVKITVLSSGSKYNIWVTTSSFNEFVDKCHGKQPSKSLSRYFFTNSWDCGKTINAAIQATATQTLGKSSMEDVSERSDTSGSQFVDRLILYPTTKDIAQALDALRQSIQDISKYFQQAPLLDSKERAEFFRAILFVAKNIDTYLNKVSTNIEEGSNLLYDVINQRTSFLTLLTSFYDDLLNLARGDVTQDEKNLTDDQSSNLSVTFDFASIIGKQFESLKMNLSAIQPNQINELVLKGFITKEARGCWQQIQSAPQKIKL